VSDAAFIASVERYYTAKLRQHGATPEGVDWNGQRSQQIRFDHLLELVGDAAEPFSINDYGCGYGALLDSLRERYSSFDYTGYDISPSMVAEASSRYADERGVAFTSDVKELHPADFTVASGVFNVKLETPSDIWGRYVLKTIERMVQLSRRGIAFNALTSHADSEHQRLNLFYADPSQLLDRCLRNYSRTVLLRHDYDLYEFTLIVRLDGRPPAGRAEL
jgi:SAM-dependent methyltransferase